MGESAFIIIKDEVYCCPNELFIRYVAKNDDALFVMMYSVPEETRSNGNLFILLVSTKLGVLIHRFIPA